MRNSYSSFVNNYYLCGMKWITTITLAMIVAMMSSCDSSTFKISADIAGMGNQQVHVVFLGDSGVSDTFIAVNDGKINIKGASSEPTVVNFLDSQNKPLFRVAVEGGETIEITGDYYKPHSYSCKGSDVAQQWMDFERENAELYDMPDAALLDQAIEKYIKENPKSLVSTLLLITDYSDITTAKAEQLLNSIDPKARPERLTSGMTQLRATYSKPINQLHTMMLCNDQGDFEAIIPSKATATLLYWWTNNNSERQSALTQMKQIAEEFGSDLQISDVSLSSDSSGWHTIIKNDSVKWQHYWAPGSIQDPAIRDLQLRQLPIFIVCDMHGKQIYRGANVKEARNAISKHIHP